MKIKTKLFFVFLFSIFILSCPNPIVEKLLEPFDREPPEDTPVTSSSKRITAFTILGVNGVINEAVLTISVTLPNGTDVTALTPTITHTGTSIHPASGVTQNFTAPVIYEVTAADNSIAYYTVTVTVAPPDTYTLTVIGGSGSTGSGSYTEGTSVPITAGTAPSGQQFAFWTTEAGGTFGNENNANTTFTIPANNVTITANFMPILYTLTVTNGSGGGNYAQGTSVTIVADTAPAGQVFQGWTAISGTFEDATNPTTTFTMPASAVTVTATYETATVDTFTVTVNGGTGDGNFKAGVTVTITATVPASNQFDEWTVNSGTITLANKNLGKTTFTMPSEDVTVTATTKAATHSVGGAGPGGGTVYYFDPLGFEVQMVNPAQNYVAHYLEVASSDDWLASQLRWASSGSPADTLISGLSQDSTDTTDRGIGRGRLNTAIILSVCSNPVTQAPAANATQSTLGGQSDWFLPSREELDLLQQNRAITIMVSATGYYWSSSQSSSDSSYAFTFTSNYWINAQKDGTNSRVRPIRAF